MRLPPHERRALRVAIPPLIDCPPKLRKAIDGYMKLLGELDEVTAKVELLDRERAGAGERDLQAAADAARRGQPDPGATHTEKAMRELGDATRREDVLERAVSDALIEFEAALDAERERWGEKVAAELVSRRATLVEGVSAIQLSHGAVVEILALRFWLASEEGVRQRGVRGARLDLEQLRGPNGDPHEWAAVLAILRESAEGAGLPRVNPRDQRTWTHTRNGQVAA